MVIWRRLGFLAPVLAFVVLIATQAAVDAVNGDGYYTANAWASTMALVLGGVVVGTLGWVMNARAREAEEPTHTLFFIPMEFWGLALAVLGVAMFFQ